MKTVIRVAATLPGLLLSLAVAGCSDILGGGDRSSSFQASLAFSSGSAGSYSGDGEFVVGVGGDGSPLFSLGSQGQADAGRQVFQLLTLGGGVPAPGAHALSTVDQSNPNARGTTAFYSRTVDGWVESYAASSGELTITSSSRNRVAGTFRFTGYRYCAVEQMGTGMEGPCRPTAQPIAGAPQVEVTGSFSAVRLDTDDIEAPVAIEPISP